MTAPGTLFSGPVLSGPVSTPAQQGYSLLSQTVKLVQNSTAAVSQTMSVPNHSQIVDIYVDPTVTWNSATSAALTIGTAAADTTYLGSTAMTTQTTRLRPSFTTTELAAMQDVGTNNNVVITVTPTGATSAGTTFVTLLYRQTLNWDTN